jgi:hypothetical protein
MTWQEDLKPDTYFLRDKPHPKVIAIGWLERHRPYTQGPTPREVVDRLVEIAKNPWQPFCLMGVHECDLCQYDGPMESSNLFIPAASGTLYAAPAMIVHTISTHWYQPPEVFCRAVMACPPMRSQEYRLALLACAGFKHFMDARR